MRYVKFPDVDPSSPSLHQQASFRILVLSGTGTPTSILKNLVSPGVGYFTILDSATVSSEDAGNNFFLERS